MQSEILTGKTDTHVATVGSHLVHEEATASFLKMQQAAAGAGIDLQIASSYRSFERQLTIWNSKARGERPLLDHNSTPLDASALDDTQKMWAILTWSALPGASRHHWGTDIDVLDKAAVPEDYRLQMITSEYDTGGVFNDLTAWLDENIQKFGFFRPYLTYRGGVRPELWHLSYAPVSRGYLEAYSLEILKTAIEPETTFELKDVVMENLKEIYQKYVANVD